MAEGLWWLVACCCESHPLEVTLRGPLDLLDGRDACSAHTSHYGTRKWLVRHDPDILSIGNEVKDFGQLVQGTLKGQN